MVCCDCSLYNFERLSIHYNKCSSEQCTMYAYTYLYVCINKNFFFFNEKLTYYSVVCLR